MTRAALSERPVDPKVVIRSVAEWHYITPEEVVAGRRHEHIVAARVDAIALIHRLSGRSWTVSAQLVGVSYGGRNSIIPRAKALSDDALAPLVEFIKERS